MKWIAGLVIVLAATVGRAAEAKDILDAAGVRGGLVVHLGCGDGKLTAALRASEAYAVIGLDGDVKNVDAARKHVAALGLQGKVSIDRLTGPGLPYADNLINLVVSEDLGRVPMDEVLRALVPGGVAYVKTGGQLGRRSLGEGGWRKTVKPWPKEIDEWSHFLHDAGNNAVADDSMVGPPRRLQWVAPPLWLRSHETASGVQAQVAAGGRLFYLFDEGPIGITDERLPDRWSVVCRDAFNGKLLWKRPLGDWGWREWGKSQFAGKDWTVLRAARVSAPLDVHRRLVADSQRLYATLGFQAPLSILDAATGEVLMTVKQTRPTQEILVSDGIVVAHVKKTLPGAEGRRGKKTSDPSTLMGVKAETGKVLWRQEAAGSIRALMTAADNGKVFYLAGGTLACLDLKTGRGLWQTQPKNSNARTLVAGKGVVLLMGGTNLDAFDAAGGKLLWHRKVPPRGGAENVDLFIVGQLAWPGMCPVDKDRNPVRKSDRAMAVGYDLRTGKEVRRVAVDNFRSPEHHHRCYRNKATSRYIISGYEGAEFMDLQGKGHLQNNWLRGACREGIMPCYGLLYVPADQCFCQPGGKLLGYTAVAAKAATPTADVAQARRLAKGDAHREISNLKSQISEGDWATYRHDAQRHGSTTASVPAEVRPTWRVKVGGRLTQPVTAGGKVFVASIDAHTVHALDAASGKELWRFTAGGRVDSPPTLYRGLVLFGSRDGYVYCLRAADGAMAWRFLAAARDRRIACFDQVESAWPVHGSVLVRGGVAYFAAGRSTYLDGGIRLWGLDPLSGKVLHTGRLEGPHRQIDGKRDVAFWVPGANADILVSEGDHIYMRQKKLTPQLKEIIPPVLSSKGEADVGLHVFATSGLLDGSGYNRTFWMYSKRWPGFQLANQAPKSGQLLAVDADTTYAVKVFYRRNVHSTMFFPGKEGYLLFADKNTTEPQIVGEEGSREPLRWLPQSDYSRGRGGSKVKLGSRAFGGDKMIGYTRADPPLWTLWLPVRVRAMVKTRDVLFVAGPPDVYDRQDPFAAIEGRKGAVLVAVSAKQGKKIAQLELDASPVFDGMIASQGRLFVSLTDGTVTCLTGR